jgi:fluoride exporter
MAALARRLWAELPVLGAIAVGGAAGAVARYAITEAWERPTTGFPWAVLTVNVVGCGLIGMLMVLIEEEVSRHHLIRPFLGVGVLGGFTTFSAYALDVEQLTRAGAEPTAAAYLVVTVAGALLAVAIGITATMAALRFRRRHR